MFFLHGVADQRIGERRHQVLEIALDRSDDPADDKRRGVLKHPDELVSQFHGLDREALLGIAISHQEHRHMLVTLADGTQQFKSQGMAGAVVLAQGPVDADGVQCCIGGHRRQPVVVGGGLDHIGVAVVELGHQVVEHPTAYLSNSPDRHRPAAHASSAGLLRPIMNPILA